MGNLTSSSVIPDSYLFGPLFGHFWITTNDDVVPTAIHLRQGESEEADLLVIDKAHQDWQQDAAHGQPHLGMEADIRVIGKEDHRRDEEDVRGCEPPHQKKSG